MTRVILPPPPPWNESDSIRETLLINFPDPADREAVRHVGRMLYDLALAAADSAQRPAPDELSSTHSEMRAVVADLRYIEGYLGMVGRSADESSLRAMDEALARYGGKVARRVGAVAAAIEGEVQAAGRVLARERRP